MARQHNMIWQTSKMGNDSPGKDFNFPAYTDKVSRFTAS